MLRSFKNVFRTNGGVKCQLNIPLNYKFALVPVDETVKYSELLKLQDILSAGFDTTVSKVNAETKVDMPLSFIEVSGDDIVTSIIKRAQDGSGDIVIRVFNASAEKSTATIKVKDGVSKAQFVNLEEEFVADIVTDGKTVEFDVEPWKIITVKITK